MKKVGLSEHKRMDNACFYVRGGWDLPVYRPSGIGIYISNHLLPVLCIYPIVRENHHGIVTGAQIFVGKLLVDHKSQGMTCKRLYSNTPKCAITFQ